MAEPVASIPAVSVDAPTFNRRESTDSFINNLATSLGTSDGAPAEAQPAAAQQAVDSADGKTKAVVAQRVTIDSLGRPHDAETGRLLPKDAVAQAAESAPQTSATPSEPQKVRVNGQEYTEQQVQEAFQALLERQTWTGQTAEEIQRINAERTALQEQQSKIQRLQWEAEQAKREADGLKLLALRDPATFAQFVQNDPDLAEPANPYQRFQQQAAPQDPLNRAVTVRDLQEMQRQQQAQVAEGRFFSTIQQTIEQGLPQEQLGVFTQRARAHVAARLEMDRLGNKISPNLSPDQLKMIVNRYVQEEQGFYKQAMETEIGKRAGAQKASAPPVLSKDGLTPMPAPSQQKRLDWVSNRDPHAFMEGILANQQAMTASAGGNV